MLLLSVWNPVMQLLSSITTNEEIKLGVPNWFTQQKAAAI